LTRNERIRPWTPSVSPPPPLRSSRTIWSISARPPPKGAASEAGKSVWGWIKGRQTSPAGAEAVADVEGAPERPENAQALQAALTKALTKDPEAAAALADLLKSHGVSLSSQTANVLGDNNKVGQANRGSSVTIA